MPADWLRVSSLAEGRLPSDIADFRPTHIVSLINPGLGDDRKPRFPDTADVHQVVRYDINSDEADAPDEDAVHGLIDWLRPVVEARRTGEPVRLISHCHQGISRSTAAALIALALYHDGRCAARPRGPARHHEQAMAEREDAAPGGRASRSRRTPVGHRRPIPLPPSASARTATAGCSGARACIFEAFVRARSGTCDPACASVLPYGRTVCEAAGIRS